MWSGDGHQCKRGGDGRKPWDPGSPMYLISEWKSELVSFTFPVLSSWPCCRLRHRRLRLNGRDCPGRLSSGVASSAVVSLCSLEGHLPFRVAPSSGLSL